MDNHYYAVERSGFELAHYGVKGMKWGVRKAIERGNSRALDRHYRKAAKKLQTLTARSDGDLVQKMKKQNAKDTLSGALASGLASGGLTYAANSNLPARQRAFLSAATGAGMAGAVGIAGAVNNMAYSTWGSKKGNAKQTAKRKEFERQMRKSFKGTKYARQIDQTKKTINRNISSIKRAMDPGAAYTPVQKPYKKSSANRKRRSGSRA